MSNLSEEEKQVLQTFKNGLGLSYAEEEIILNLIDRLQKENEELKEGLNFRVSYCKKLEQELYGEDFEETLVEEKYYVSKDKLIELLQIDNIDVVHCKIKKMLEE